MGKSLIKYNKIEEIIEEVLANHKDLNMSSDSARRLLAKEIAEKVKVHTDKLFMQEYEMIITGK